MYCCVGGLACNSLRRQAQQSFYHPNSHFLLPIFCILLIFCIYFFQNFLSLCLPILSLFQTQHVEYIQFFSNEKVKKCLPECNGLCQIPCENISCLLNKFSASKWDADVSQPVRILWLGNEMAHINEILLFRQDWYQDMSHILVFGAYYMDERVGFPKGVSKA